MTRDQSNWLLFWTFLKIGSTAFGGFMALIAVVQNYLVNRKKLLTDSEVLDGISLATILPGPVAVNVVAYAGYKINGVTGAIVCTVAVILPSFILMLLISHLYFTWGEIPGVNNIFKGFIPAVAAIIIAAAFNMSKKTLKGVSGYVIALTALLILVLAGSFYSTIGIIIASGLAGLLLFKKPVDKINNSTASEAGKSSIYLSILAFISIPAAAMMLPMLKASSIVILNLLVTFAGMSVLLFGGGFVFIPMIQEIVVDTYHWLSIKEFIDGIALGQITPGPILISATFIGYKVAGVAGAVAATIGIFTPPVILMLLSTRFLDVLKHSIKINAILTGVRCGVIGMIASAAVVVLQSAEHDWISLVILLAALVSLIKLKIEVAWIIPVSGLLGFLLY